MPDAQTLTNALSAARRANEAAGYRARALANAARAITWHDLDGADFWHAAAGTWAKLAAFERRYSAELARAAAGR